MTESIQRTTIPPPRGRCVRCGYDLRGRESEVCPECGTSTSVPIAIPGAQQFHLARAALERDGLLVRFTNPGGSLGTIGVLYGGDHGSPGYLWVDSREQHRVESCLSEAGVAWEFGALPIVDRSEPQCPTCENTLEADGPELCAHCGAAFQWVEIDVGDVNPDGESCACGYELQGLTADGNCPECGRNIAAYLGPSEPRVSDDAESATEMPHSDEPVRPRIIPYVLLVGAGTLLALISPRQGSALLGVGGLLWLVGAIGIAHFAIVRGRPRR